MTPKTIRAGQVDVAYLEYGAPDGWPCVMGHGFPYAPQAYAEAAPLLADAGARVIVPYLRGYGPTRFVSPNIPRSGEQAALGADLKALLESATPIQMSQFRDRNGLWAKDEESCVDVLIVYDETVQFTIDYADFKTLPTDQQNLIRYARSSPAVP